LAGQRVFFRRGKQRQLLQSSKALSQLTWEEYSTKIGVSSYNVLRAIYLSERNSLPLPVVNQAVQFLRDDEWKSWVRDFREEHWGQVKGGSISLKAWHMRMKQNPRKYREVQCSRFCSSRNYKYMTSAGYEVRSSFELFLAENLIVNRVPHQYEPMVRCGDYILFPDFYVRGGSGNALIEICGFRFKQVWKRLCKKLRIYLSHNLVDLVIVAYPKHNEKYAMAVAERFNDSVQFTTLENMPGLLSMLKRLQGELVSFRIVTEAEALRRCRQVDGKRIHWQRLLATTPRELWIETLVTCGLSEIEVKRIREIDSVQVRLIEATRLVTKSGRVPREALVEMIAGTCNGSAGDHFGSMGNLVRIADSPVLEKFR